MRKLRRKRIGLWTTTTTINLSGRLFSSISASPRWADGKFTNGSDASHVTSFTWPLHSSVSRTHVPLVFGKEVRLVTRPHETPPFIDTEDYGSQAPFKSVSISAFAHRQERPTNERSRFDAFISHFFLSSKTLEFLRFRSPKNTPIADRRFQIF